MRNNKLIQILCVTLIILTASTTYAQENNNLKRFAVKLYNGYSLSYETSKLQIVGGNYNMGNSSTVGLSVAWYYNKNWSAELSASTGKYKIDMVNGNYTNMAMYRNSMSLGYVWIAPVSLSARYHLTVSKKIVPYASAGGSYLFFTNVDPGWGASSVEYQNRPAFHFAIGTDYNINNHWFVNTEIRKFFTDNSNIDVTIMKWELKTQMKPNPINFSVGIGYRF